jgi:hypothetical protein
MPPPDTTPQTDPGLAEGPRKRRPTERVTENGDPLVRKKARIITASGNIKSSTKVTNAARRLTTSDVPKRAPRTHARPVHANRIPEVVAGSDDEFDSNQVDTGHEADETNNSINVDEEPEVEDDVTELSTCCVHLFGAGISMLIRQ